MKDFLRRISPKRAALDFAGAWKQPTPHRWPILGVAAALTFALFMLFIPESKRIIPARPDVIFISTWEDGRTEREIIASNCENQLLKDELQAKMEQRAEISRDMYRALGRATFIDVEEIEREAEAERARLAEAEQPSISNSPDAAMTVEEYCARALG